MSRVLLFLVLGLVLFLPVAMAVEFNGSISASDKQTFDNILSPVMKVYNFIKYAATVLAVVLLVFAGITFITSGGDQGKRESAKSTAMYIVIGLIVIWVAPLIVQYIAG